MIFFVLGGSGSGKSEFAENILQNRLSGDKYYIATMQVFDEEVQKKVDRHRRLRKDKGFFTIEAPTDVDKECKRFFAHEMDCIATKINSRKDTKKSAILECVSNLTANEMFNTTVNTAVNAPTNETAKKTQKKDKTEKNDETEKNAKSETNIKSEIMEYTVEKIISDIEGLAHIFDNLVIVGNNVFDDGILYDQMTQSYIEAMGRINEKIVAMADEVYEVVVGIECIIS